jgi:SAM-dependent methyltransferase
MLCILCGRPKRHLFSSHDQARRMDQTKYDVWWCDSCDFGRIVGDFTPKQVAEFYDFDYYTHGQKQTTPSLSLWQKIKLHAAWRVDRGSDFAADDVGSAKSVCDVGCGAGARLKALKEIGCDVVGIEPDPAARRIASAVCRVHDGTAESIPTDVPRRSFDAVIMTHVLEHCINPGAAVKNVSSLLKQDGRFIVEVPNNAAKGFWTYKENWPWSDIPRHLNFFTEKSLRSLLENCGFTIERADYAGYCRQFSPEWPSSLSLLVRTAFTAPAQKYDSIRLTARAEVRPHGSTMPECYRSILDQHRA